MITERQVIMKLDADLVKQAKIKAIQKDISFREYVSKLIQRDLQNKKE